MHDRLVAPDLEYPRVLRYAAPTNIVFLTYLRLVDFALQPVTNGMQSTDSVIQSKDVLISVSRRFRDVVSTGGNCRPSGASAVTIWKTNAVVFHANSWDAMV